MQADYRRKIRLFEGLFEGTHQCTIQRSRDYFVQEIYFKEDEDIIRWNKREERRETFDYMIRLYHISLWKCKVNF